MAKNISFIFSYFNHSKWRLMHIWKYSEVPALQKKNQSLLLTTVHMFSKCTFLLVLKFYLNSHEGPSSVRYLSTCIISLDSLLGTTHVLKIRYVLKYLAELGSKLEIQFCRINNENCIKVKMQYSLLVASVQQCKVKYNHLN